MSSPTGGEEPQELTDGEQAAAAKEVPAGRRHARIASGPARSGIGPLWHLAWPSILSFTCNGLYRVNDQYWMSGLGPDAQAALGASFFVLILNFSLYFVAVAGSLPLVARATGRGDALDRERIVRHTLFLGTLMGLALMAFSNHLAPAMVFLQDMEGGVAEQGTAYLMTMYGLALPMALSPIVDNVFIGMGHTRVPLVLQLVAVSTNFVLNPCLIYGWGPFEAHGIAGAAIATCTSRGLAVLLGLGLLRLRYDVHVLRELSILPRRLWTIVRIGVPSALSITIYAAVYLALYRYVLTDLGRDVMAGLGIGFNAFEGISFPFFLGVAVAGSSLVGRNLGADAPEEAWRAVRSMRVMATALGLMFLALFLLLAPVIVPAFTDSEAVQGEAMLYVRILAVAQLFVAMEAIHEKVLLGAGHTVPIFAISVPMNALRVPLAWFLAFPCELGPAGVWWAINSTTLLKAVLFGWLVQRRGWLTRELRT